MKLLRSLSGEHREVQARNWHGPSPEMRRSLCEWHEGEVFGRDEAGDGAFQKASAGPGLGWLLLQERLEWMLALVLGDTGLFQMLCGVLEKLATAGTSLPGHRLASL